MDIDLKIFSKREILKSTISQKYKRIAELRRELNDEEYILEVLEEKYEEIKHKSK